MAETSYIIQNGRRLNLKDASARKQIGSCDELQTETKHCLVHAINELNQKVGSGGGGGFKTDETLLFENGVLSVNMEAVVAALPTYNGEVEDV